MKRMRNVVALLLGTALCAGLLSGCGSQGAEGGKNPDAQQEAPESTDGEQGDSTPSAEGDEEPYEIVYELINMGSTPEDLDMVAEAINEITLPAINCTVKFLPVAMADHAQKTSLLAAGGEKVDVILAGATANPVNLVANGVLTDLTDLLPEYAPTLLEMEGEMLEAGTFDGRKYLISGSLYPAEKRALIYNADMAEEYGITIPDNLSTWADWDAFLAECKEKLPEGTYPLTLGDGGASNHWNFRYFDSLGDDSFLTYGVLPFDGEEVVNWYATDTYRETVEKKREYYEAGYCVPDSMTSGFSANDCLKANTCFATVSGLSLSRNELNPGANIGMNLGAVILSEPYLQNSSLYLYTYGIPVTCERPEKALQFLELAMTNTDLANLINYGIEGTHYVVTEEGSKVIDYPEGVDASNCGYTGKPSWIGNHMEGYVRKPATEEYYTLSDSYAVENASVSPALGFAFDATSVKTEIAAVQTVIDTYRPSLECGVVDVETELPKFLEALEEAGINKIVEECQNQYSQWKAE